MKTNKFILLGITSLLFVSCNDSFLERYPESSISEKISLNP